MKEEEVTKYILSAANGDELAREKLIRHYKPFIINTVGHICKRYITWSDEESSVGLLAFNRSIDTYNNQAQKSFLNYVYLLIKRDLIDFFRREKKVMHVPLEVEINDDETPINVYEQKKSIDSYYQSVAQQELVEEIMELRSSLSEYGIGFEELERFSPKHQKTIRKLITIASDLLKAPSLLESFLRNKRLPITALAKQTDHSRKTLERHRKYIVTLVLLKLHPEWQQLREYLRGPLGSEEEL